MRTSSRANKGQYNKIKYEDEQAQQQQQPRPKRQRLQPQPQPQQQIAIPAIPLPAVVVNDNRNKKRPQDFGEIKENVYFQLYFYTPDDEITKNILRLLKIMKDCQHLWLMV